MDKIVEVTELPWPKADNLDYLISDEIFRSEVKRFLDRFYEPKFKFFGPPMTEPNNYIMLFETYSRFLADPTVGNTVYVSRRMPKIPEKPDESLVNTAELYGHEYDQIAFSETLIADVLRKMVSEYLETKQKDSEEYRHSEHLLETPFVTSPDPNDDRQFVITTYEEIENGSPLPPDVGAVYLHHIDCGSVWCCDNYVLAQSIVPMLNVLDALPRSSIKIILVEKDVCEFLRELRIDQLNEMNLSDHISWPYFRNIFDMVRSQNVHR